MTLYGLKACDTCRKARQAIEKAGKSVEFVDVRETPLSPDMIKKFFAEFGEDVINRRSTTWRGLTEAERGRAPEALLADQGEAHANRPSSREDPLPHREVQFRVAAPHGERDRPCGGVNAAKPEAPH